MDFDDNPDQAAFRAEARRFIREHAPWEIHDQVLGLRFTGHPFADDGDAVRHARAWQARKYDAGFACLTWPREYGGRGLGPVEDAIFRQEEGDFARLTDIFMIGQGMCAATLMHFASEAQKCHHLPRIGRGDEFWCQMFSEPGAGSDLAGIRTRAVRVEGGWRVDGQKVWTSGAHLSDWGTLLVRTDPDLPKHKGLTMLFVDMRSPGITVRPIRQIHGHVYFNEVFLDDVFVPDAHRLGGVNEGWRAALVTLNSERAAIGAALPFGFDEIFELAETWQEDGRPLLESGDVQQRLADWYVKANGIKFGVYRQLSALANGIEPGPEAAAIKLVRGIATQDMAAYALDLLETRGLAPDADDRLRVIENLFCFGAQHRIEGGADEILKNILAERALGMPPEIRLDRDIPFKDVPNAPRA